MLLSILVVLVTVNTAWKVASEYSGPLIALILYVVAAFLCWRRNHFQAGIIAGMAGLGIHIYELILWGVAGLGLLDLGLPLVNLIGTIPLMYFSYKAYREIGKMKEDDLKRLHL